MYVSALYIGSSNVLCVAMLAPEHIDAQKAEEKFNLPLHKKCKCFTYIYLGSCNVLCVASKSTFTFVHSSWSTRHYPEAGSEDVYSCGKL
jgi:hypothetical protein